MRYLCTKDGINRNSGVSIIEALLAIAVFGVLAAGTLTLVWDPLTSSGSTDERSKAIFLAQEGIDAARAIRNDEWKATADGTHGIDKTSGKWVYSGANDVDGIYTRVVTIDPVNRDVAGDIVTTGGTLDERTKKITSTVSWPSIFGGAKSLSYETYLTNWNTYDWTQTTDSDFNSGTHNQTIVADTGDAAYIELSSVTGAPKDWISSEGDLYIHTTDAHWNAGTLTDTISVGSGIPASVTGTGAPQWIRLAVGGTIYETTDTDFSDGTFSDVVVVDTGDLGGVSLDTQLSWAKDTSSPIASAMNAISLSSSIAGFAVGAGGEIIRWDGIAWSTVTSPTASALYGVHMISGSDGFAVGLGGTIIRWNGSVWSSVTSPVSNALNAVSCASASMCFAAGASGKILEWNGATWTQHDDTGNDTWTAAHMVSTTDGWIVSSKGAVLRWDGVAWNTVSSPTNKSMNGISCGWPSSCFAVGASGTIIQWNGSSWSTAASPTGVALNSVSMVSASDGWAVGTGGELIEWDGVSWTTSTSPTADAMNGIIMVSSSDGFAVGLGGTVWQFKQNHVLSGTYESGVLDGGAIVDWGRLFWGEDLPVATDITVTTRSGPTATVDGSWSGWSGGETDPFGSIIESPDNRYFQYRLTLSTTDQFVAPRLNNITVTFDEPATDTFFEVLEFPSLTDGWAVGAGGALARYDGIEWMSYPSPVTDALLAVDYHDENNVWAVGASGTIVYWNGSTWTAQVSGTTNTLYDVDVISATEVYAVGQRGAILSYDGVSWFTMTSPVNKNLNNVSFLTGSDAWAVGDNGTIIRWDGVNWSSFTSPTTSPLSAVSMVTASFGVIVGQGGLTIHWDGANWAFVTNPTSNKLSDVHCIAVDDCWAVGVAETFLHWDGIIWSGYVFANKSNPLVEGIFMTHNSLGWAVGESGAFYKYTSFIPSPAFFESSVIDSGTVGLLWNTITWDSLEPASTSITVATRTGPTATPDASWSAWSAEFTDKGGSTITSVANQYIQYRISFTTSDNSKTATLQGVRIMANAPTGQNLYACEGTAVSDVWAAGRAGTIIHYDGVSWSAVTSPVIQDINGLDVVSASEAYGVTDGGHLIRWEGTLWNTLTTPTVNDLNDISMASSSFGVAVGQSGTILHWDGVDWLSASSPTVGHLFGVHLFTASDGWAVGANGTIINWDGVDWTTVTSPVATDLNDVHLTSISYGWAAGDGGEILNWDGVNWTSVTTPVVSKLNSIEGRSAAEAWALGNFGVILEWDGVNWTSFTSPTTRDLYDVTVQNPTDGWGCGEKGTLLKDPPPYQSPGVFYSSVLDTDSTAATFDTTYFNFTVPVNTTLEVSTRTGPTPMPDGSWSGYSAAIMVGTGTTITSPGNRYFQYRLIMTTTDTNVTPTFEDITVTYRK